MIILGICGFEDIDSPENRHVYSIHTNTPEELFDFSDKHVPLQYFPLHLIGHDSSASLIVAGQLVAFAAEERFTRVKHGFNLIGRTVLPRKAIAFCLKRAGISWKDVDAVAHYCHFTPESVEKRLQNVSQNLNSDHSSFLREDYTKSYKNRLSKNAILQKIGKLSGGDFLENQLVQVRHHLAHAAGAYYSTDFNEAIVLTLDGYGEEESSLWAIGQDNKISVKGSIDLPTSLGLLYQVVTAYLGFRSFGDEYKVMGLSSYGDYRQYQSFFDDLIDQSDDGSYSVQKLTRVDLVSWLKEELGNIKQENVFSQKKADIAASLQKTLERIILDQLSELKKKYQITKLCLSGGVGLNACLNGTILRAGLFDKVFFQPASGDDGTSLGAAMYVHHALSDQNGRELINHVFWGPDFDSGAIETVLCSCPQIEWRKERNIEAITAKLLDEGKIVGWFQGRMEMGPRALGARSILADPRSTVYRDEINEKVKGRESFRPFAPSVLEEMASAFFEIPDNSRSPFMLATFPARESKKHLIPAVIHVDGSSRLQTVSSTENPRYHSLLHHFYKRTGIPVLLNTSFNRAGEPIVNSPDDALNCFLKCDMDALVIEDYLIFRRQNQA